MNKEELEVLEQVLEQVLNEELMILERFVER